MRIRSIKPEFWRSSSISKLAIEDRLLFIGLWSYVDDNGVGIDKLSLIVADLFADDIEANPSETFARVSRGLARLSEAGRIVRYTVENDDFLCIVNWSEHQRIDKPGKARYPHVSGENVTIREGVAKPRESVAPGTGEQGNRGTEDQGTGEQKPRAAVNLAPLFDTAYEAWPKKVERKQAFERFKTAAKRKPPEELVEAIVTFGEAYAATTDKQFIPNLAAWINGERWTDDLPAAPVQQVKQTAAQRNLATVAYFQQQEQGQLEIEP